MVHIRKAIKDDCPQLLTLVHELAAYEKAPQQVTITLEHFTESGFGENPVWWALVAESTDGDKTVIVGFALYYIRFSTWKGQSVYLEDLIVTEPMRGKGIGKLLFDGIIEECKQKNMRRLCWQVLDWNQPAINFYKKYAAQFDGEWLNGSIEISKR